MPHFKPIFRRVVIVSFITYYVNFCKAQDLDSASEEELTCNDLHYKCADGSACIYKGFLCDNDQDCTDGSDEIDSICKVKCSEDFGREVFQCKTNEACISKRLVCNGKPNCEDGSDEDEELCATCGGYDFLVRCPNGGRCIQKSWFCDGERDCPGDEIFDEDPAVCADNCGGMEKRFQCADKSCIHAEDVCDGNPQCPDGSDDSAELCATCNGDADKTMCRGSTRCIFKTFICDGDKDCESGSDEENCPESLPQDEENQ